MDHIPVTELPENEGRPPGTIPGALSTVVKSRLDTNIDHVADVLTEIVEIINLD
jgi:hypothetical protein